MDSVIVSYVATDGKQPEQTRGTDKQVEEIWG